IILSIPAILFSIAFIQVKRPDIEVPSFKSAVQAHNDRLVNALAEKSQTDNASVIMNEELENLRKVMRGRQVGEKSDFRAVLHVSMGVGDDSLPYRLEWLPILICCSATVSILTVILAVYFTTTVDRFMSEMGTFQKEDDDDISTAQDIVLRKRKIENPHQPVE
ncbi:hypothetical protein PMAYCL1PPCAC_32234, partial [Pristionchus mayeri]